MERLRREFSEARGAEEERIAPTRKTIGRDRYTASDE